MFEVLPGRDLTEAELSAVVSDVAADRELWSHLVSCDPGQRIYVELHSDEHVSIWLICWMDSHDTGFHDHDGSAGALAVVSGALREERLRFGAPVGHTLRAGEGELRRLALGDDEELRPLSGALRLSPEPAGRAG